MALVSVSWASDSINEDSPRCVPRRALRPTSMPVPMLSRVGERVLACLTGEGAPCDHPLDRRRPCSAYHGPMLWLFCPASLSQISTTLTGGKKRSRCSAAGERSQSCQRHSSGTSTGAGDHRLRMACHPRSAAWPQHEHLRSHVFVRPTCQITGQTRLRETVRGAAFTPCTTPAGQAPSGERSSLTHRFSYVNKP